MWWDAKETSEPQHEQKNLRPCRSHSSFVENVHGVSKYTLTWHHSGSRMCEDKLKPQRRENGCQDTNFNYNYTLVNL